MAAQNPDHYVDNVEFYNALCVWKDAYVEAENKKEPKPPLPEYVGDCFVKMAKGLARRSCFANYDFKEEMISDAIENAVLYAHNFKKEGKNPFAYFTQMMYYAFLRRIQKEKKQMYVKYKLIEKDSHNIKGIVRWDEEELARQVTGGRISKTDLKNFSSKKTKKTKNDEPDSGIFGE